MKVLMKLPLFQRLFACITNNRLDEYDPSRNSEIYYDIASQKFINIDESYDMIVKNICLGDLLPYTTDFIINNNLTKEIIVLPPSAHSLKNRYYGIFISKNFQDIKDLAFYAGIRKERWYKTATEDNRYPTDSDGFKLNCHSFMGRYKKMTFNDIISSIRTGVHERDLNHHVFYENSDDENTKAFMVLFDAGPFIPEFRDLYKKK